MKKVITRLNRKNCFIAITTLILIIAIILIIIFNSKKSEEDKLNDMLKELGVNFYENFYYDQVGTNDTERKEFVKKYETIGIKVNLDNLSRLNSDDSKKMVDKFVNSKTKKECDKSNTRVIIYPKTPYEKDSYDIKTELVCGFDESK